MKLKSYYERYYTQAQSRPFFVAAGALNGFSAVALWAFGAHGLRGRIPDSLLHIFETAAQYQAVHALASIGVGALLIMRESRCLVAVG